MIQKIGFTGTRDGMTEAQITVLLKCLMFDTQITEAHHGMCVGADAQFHEMMRKIDPNKFIQIIGHPAIGVQPLLRAKLLCDQTREARPPLERNHDIVDECDILLAATKQDHEVQRSGTWSTIRYAKSIKRDTVIIYPGGGVNMFCNSISQMAAILAANRKAVDVL